MANPPLSTLPKKRRIVIIHMGVHKLRLSDDDYSSEEEIILGIQQSISEVLKNQDIVVLDSWFSGIKTSRRYWILASEANRVYIRFAGWMVEVLKRLREKI